MDYKDFEQFGLTPEDFTVDIINIKEFDNVYKKAVRVSIPQLNTGVDSWSEKSQIKNKEKCMTMLFTIVKDIFNQEESIKCYQCGKEIKNYKYLVHIINSQGKKEFVYTCSEECGNKTIEQNSQKHYKRFKDVNNQSPQKIDI